MAFLYTRPPLTQGISSFVLVLGGIGLMATPAVADSWSHITATVPEWVLVVVVPLLVHHVLFWGMAAAFHLVDKYDAPNFIARYRIQSGKVRRPPLRRSLRNLAINQLILSPLMMFLMWQALLLRGWTLTPELPGPLTVLGQLAALGACAAIWFYASHRFLHRPWWMKKVHRVHHEFRTTTAMASEYAHPFEFVAANFITLAGGVVLLAPSAPVIYLWELIAVHTVIAHHSGYAVPWMSWAVHHDWHHYRYKECFGTTGVLDRLLGTDPEFSRLEHGQEVK